MSARLIYSKDAIVATDEGDTHDLSQSLIAGEKHNPESGARISLKSDNISGTNPDFTVLIQHSPDGAEWFTADTFTAVTLDAIESREITVAIHSLVRANVSAISGTDTPTVDLDIWIE